MRRIDFWAGVPLCFLVTLADRLLRAAGMKGRGHGRRPRHILFIQLAEMGTMVVAYPALRRALRAAVRRDAAELRPRGSHDDGQRQLQAGAVTRAASLALRLSFRRPRGGDNRRPRDDLGFCRAAAGRWGT